MVPSIADGFELRRRSVLGTVALAALPWTGAIGRVRAAVQGGGMPQFQGDAGNTGHVPGECVPTADLERAWEIQPDELELTDITLTAVDGTLYAGGYHNSALVSVDPDTGAIRWRWETDFSSGEFRETSYPAADADAVYYGVGEPWSDGRAGVHGVVYALDAGDGAVRWRAGVGRGPAYVTLDGDSVYAGSRGALYALDAEDGAGRWGHVPADPEAYIYHPAVPGDVAFYTTDAGRVYALSAATGEERWSMAATARTAPSVAGGRVYVGEGTAGAGVRALDAVDGSERWRFAAPGPVTHPPVAAGGRVFTWSREGGDGNGVLSAIDASSGELDWAFRTPSIYSGPLPPLAVGDAVVVVGNPSTDDYDNAVYVVGADSGELRTRIDVRVDVGTAAPVVLDDTLFVGDNSVGTGYVSAYTGGTACGESDGESHTLMITANGPTDYSVTVDGTLEADTRGGNFRGESGDAPTENDDGTWTASDGTGPGRNHGGSNYHGDRYVFTGAVEALTVAPRESVHDANVYLDEELVPVGTVRGFDGGTGDHTLMIAANGPTDYVVTVDGTLEPDTFGGDFRSESDDAPTENDDGTWTASDGTGPGGRTGGTNFLGDRFVFTGSVEAFGLTVRDSAHEANVYIDERNVSPEDVRRFDG